MTERDYKPSFVNPSLMGYLLPFTVTNFAGYRSKFPFWVWRRICIKTFTALACLTFLVSKLCNCQLVAQGQGCSCGQKTKHSLCETNWPE